MSSAAIHLSKYLQTLGHGSIKGKATWALSVAIEPDAPDNVITLYDTGGEEPDTEQLDLFRNTVQVRVRAVKYVDAYEKAKAIRRDLIAAQNVTIDGVRYMSLVLTTDIASLGETENRRFVVVMNYRVINQQEMA